MTEQELIQPERLGTTEQVNLLPEINQK